MLALAAGTAAGTAGTAGDFFDAAATPDLLTSLTFYHFYNLPHFLRTTVDTWLLYVPLAVHYSLLTASTTFTPYLLIYEGHLHVISLLLVSGASIEARQATGQSSLAVAVAKRNRAATALLLRQVVTVSSE